MPAMAPTPPRLGGCDLVVLASTRTRSCVRAYPQRHVPWSCAAPAAADFLRGLSTFATGGTAMGLAARTVDVLDRRGVELNQLFSH